MYTTNDLKQIYVHIKLKILSARLNGCNVKTTVRTSSTVKTTTKGPKAFTTV